MKQRIATTSELLVLADGRILAHNITPGLAALLRELDPGDRTMQARAAALNAGQPKTPAPLARPGKRRGH